KNEISPATTTWSGNGKLVIFLYCSDGEKFASNLAPYIEDAAEGGIVTIPLSSIGRSHSIVVIATRALVNASGRAAPSAVLLARLASRCRATLPTTLVV